MHIVPIFIPVLCAMYMYRCTHVGTCVYLHTLCLVYKEQSLSILLSFLSHPPTPPLSSLCPSLLPSHPSPLLPPPSPLLPPPSPLLPPPSPLLPSFLSFHSQYGLHRSIDYLCIFHCVICHQQVPHEFYSISGSETREIGGRLQVSPPFK